MGKIQEKSLNKLPAGWRWVKLGAIAGVSGGVLFDKQEARRTPGNDGWRILRGGNIQDGQVVDTEDELYVPAQLISAEQRVAPGDVLVVISTGSKRLIGKVGIVREELPCTSYGAFLCRIRPKEQVEPRFFGNYFLTEAYRQWTLTLAQGSSIYNLRKSQLEELPFPLPPLECQHRIADRLEPLLARLAQARRLVREGVAMLEQERSALIPKLLESRQWPLVELGTLIRLRAGDALPRSRMNREGGIPVYGGNGVSGYHDRWNRQKGTIVIGRVGSNCGQVYLAETEAWVTDNALSVEYDESRLDPGYLYHVLCSYQLRRFANSSAQPLLSGKVIYPLPIPLPPIDEQRRFANRMVDLHKRLETVMGLITETDMDQLGRYAIEQVFWDHSKEGV